MGTEKRARTIEVIVLRTKAGRLLRPRGILALQADLDPLYLCS